MRRSEERDDEPRLFDLPLAPPEGNEPAARKATTRPKLPAAPREEPALPLVETRPRERAGRPAEREPANAAEEAAGRPTAGSRLAAGCADLLVHAALAVTVVAGSRLMGARPTLEDGPALVLFLLTFSFLYTVLPLAFWGQTLGMAWAGLAARGRGGEALTFDQSARRWLGSLLTALTAGLPLLVSRRGRSLTDRLSGSETIVA